MKVDKPFIQEELSFHTADVLSNSWSHWTETLSSSTDLACDMCLEKYEDCSWTNLNLLPGQLTDALVMARWILVRTHLIINWWLQQILNLPVPVLHYLPVLLCIAIYMSSHLTEELHGRKTSFKWGKSESEWTNAGLTLVLCSTAASAQINLHLSLVSPQKAENANTQLSP